MRGFQVVSGTRKLCEFCVSILSGVRAVRARPFRRHPRWNALRRRWLRATAMIAFVAMALVLTTEQASADGATLPALSMPHLSWSALADWFKDPTWGHIPRQQGGSAAGLSHRASTDRRASCRERV